MNDDKQLERNVERLLSRARPELAMPEESKKRVLSALQAAQPSSWRSRLPWTAAVAAAAALLLFLFWPGGMNGGLAWAEVVRHFNDVQSLAARVIMESVSPSGVRMVSEARLYQKDPGRSRSEMLAPDGGIATVVIMNSDHAQSSITRLSPGERVAKITTLTFSGAALDSRTEMPRDLVADSWSRLKEVTSDRTTVIGEGEIGEIAVVGFEIDIQELFEEPSAARMDGVMRVWADQQSGVPLKVEAEFTDPGGVLRMTIFSDIEWNPPLADELFVLPDLEGWEVLEESVEE